jgi:IS30 family transposase
MTNYVGVAMENSIITLKCHGWSNSRIALQLSVNRKTVNTYVKRHLRFNDCSSQLSENSGQSYANRTKYLAIFIAFFLKKYFDSLDYDNVNV